MTTQTAPSLQQQTPMSTQTATSIQPRQTQQTAQTPEVAKAAPPVPDKNKNVKETRNLIAFTTMLSKSVVGHPGIATAFKKRDFAALGPFFLSLAQNKELCECGAKAFDGMKQIPDEIKGMDFLNGAELASDALQGIKDVYSAYAVTQLGEDGHGNEAVKAVITDGQCQTTAAKPAPAVA